MTRLRILPVAAALALAACAPAASSSTDAVVDALAEPTTTVGGQATTPSTTVADGCGTSWQPTQSFAPEPGPPPPPSAFPPESTMQRIRDRGYVVVGVDENTVPLAFRDGGDFRGFEIDLARLVAEALTGNRDAVQLKTLTTNQKTAYVESGEVDLAIDAISMTCRRWRAVSFTQPYYEAVQRVMVRRDSPITTAADLDGTRVCVTTGGTSAAEVKAFAPNTVDVPVDTRTECLVALEHGDADFLFTHDTFLFGFLLQDPTVQVILPEIASPTSYGIAVPKGDEDLVRFLNSSLEQWRTEGVLDELAATWFTPPAGQDVGSLDVLRPIPTPSYRSP